MNIININELNITVFRKIFSDWRKRKVKLYMQETNNKDTGQNMLKRYAVCLVFQLCPTLWDLMDYSPPGSSVHGDSSAKNTGVGCHALLQGIFPTQGSNPDLPQCRQILYHLSHHNKYKKCCLYLYQAKDLTYQKGTTMHKTFTTCKGTGKNMKENFIGLMKSRQNPELYLEI